MRGNESKLGARAHMPPGTAPESPGQHAAKGEGANRKADGDRGADVGLGERVGGRIVVKGEGADWRVDGDEGAEVGLGYVLRC